MWPRPLSATNRLRHTRLLLEADRADASLREVVAAGLELRMIKHQIWSTQSLPNPPFRDHRELTYLFESLYHYADWIASDLAAAKNDMLKADGSAPDLEALRQGVMAELDELLVDSDGSKTPDPPWSWARYEATEGIALERLTRTTLAGRSSRLLR